MTTNQGTTRRPIRKNRLDRRGVVAILAMMFLVLFGSLGVAMAIASKGNLRTASTHIHVIRATGAAETGLAVGAKRLQEASARFIISSSDTTGSLMWKMWSGTATGSDTRMSVQNPAGFVESGLPAGIAQALVNCHNADNNKLVFAGNSATASINGAPTGTDSNVYKTTNWVVTPVVAIDGIATDAGSKPAAYQISYIPLADGNTIRVVATGYSSISANGTSFAYGSQDGTAPVTRTIYRDFKLTKRHKHAIVSPTKIMIGRGVNIEGSVGAAFTDVDKPTGDPLVMKSDFYGLNPILDAKLRDLFAGIATYDVDGDNRLRVNHPTESQGIPPGTRDYDGNGTGDNAFADVTGDGYIDDYDVFLKHYDANGDGKLVLSNALTAGTPAAGLSPEFTDDDDLARLIDSGLPDRNKNGVSGWQDTNRNGRWDAGENLNDFDAATGTYPDRVLGWRDGFIDRKDLYAKVRGRLFYRTTQAAWETGQSHRYQTAVNGAVRPPSGESPSSFNVGESDMPDITVADMTSATTGLRNAANGQSFDTQVATQLGISTGALPTYTETRSGSVPRYFRSNMSNAAAKALTGQDLFERMPFNSPTFTDWYVRPRYENMTFRDVQIPAGNNGLFVNCTFVGATYVRTNTSNTHTNWSLYGKMNWDSASGAPVLDTTPLDKSDFLRYTTNVYTDGPANYADFPDPPVINSAVKTGANRNTKLYSNNIRFHNCLFVGSIVSDTPSVFTPVRNKLQFTGSTRFTSTHPDQPENAALNPESADVAEIAKSSLMLPQYSVDLGQFNSPTDSFAGGPTPQSIQLAGTIIAGVLDARGNTDINGTLLMTFKPVLGQAPMEYNGQAAGNPANFNTTLGYFGPSDGDQEALDPATLPTVGGVKIVGYDVNGDGLPDTAPNDPQPAGSTPVPFYGYGRISVRWNPDLPMPNGIMLPISIVPVTGSYREGKP